MLKSGVATKIANNTIYQIVGKFISMSITMLAVMIITRNYGKEGYGSFSLMQTFPALFFVIVDFGINAIAARELSKDWSKANKYLGNIILIRLLFSFLLILLINISLSFFPYSTELKSGIRLSLFLLLTQSLYTTANIFFQVKLKYDYSAISYTIGYLVILALVLSLSYLKVDVKWVNFSYVIGGIVTLLMCSKFIKKLGIKPDFAIDKDLWKYLVLSALPLGIMFCFSQVSFKQDSLMVSVMKLPSSYGLNNTESVAVYALAYKVFEVFLVIPTFFMNSAYPVLVRHMVEGKEKLKNTFSKVILFLLFSGLLVGFLGVILSPMVVKVIGGEGFDQSVLALRILSSGLVIFYLSQPISWLIVTLGYQARLPFIYFLSAVFNVAANIVFIPKYSFYASAVITILTEILILVLLIFTAKKSWRDKYVES
ncbi:MAG: flippase [Patescibacteria group bacterium]